MKPWYKSKTVWLNVIAVATAVICAMPGVIPTWAMSGIMAGFGAINVILRGSTSTALGKPEAPKEEEPTK